MQKSSQFSKKPFIGVMNFFPRLQFETTVRINCKNKTEKVCVYFCCHCHISQLITKILFTFAIVHTVRKVLADFAPCDWWCYCRALCGAGNSLIGFLSESLIFLRKNLQMRDLLQKTSDSLIFGERPERFAHCAHFWWATWAIHSHRSLKKREWANRSGFLNLQKMY